MKKSLMNELATGDDITNETESFENLDDVRLINERSDPGKYENLLEIESLFREMKETDQRKIKKVEFDLDFYDPQAEKKSCQLPSSSSTGSSKDKIIGKYRKLENLISGHYRSNSDVKTTQKNMKTMKIMASVQLGIHHSIGSLASKPERDLLMNDFMVVESTNFASEGSSRTPAHNYSQFVFKTYAPIAFRYFRELFRIPTEDYLISFCKSPLNELSAAGSSGSIFYVTNDDKFIMKTMQNRESEFLQKLLPGYYMNLHQNPKTLLPKFFGLYCYKCETRKIRLVAMNNLLPSHVKLQKYDLKGSTYKRKAAKKLKKDDESPSYKDLDFVQHYQEGIFLDSEMYHELKKTVERDCRVLESFQIMDYSLLLGIHILDKDKLPISSENDNITRIEVNMETLGNHNLSINMEKDGKDSKKPFAEERNLIQKEHQNINFHLQCGIPAKTNKGDKLSIFIGIIDILQSYRLVKKIEHSWKSIIHNGDTVSVHNPRFYSQRFQKFLFDKVFKKTQGTGGFRSRSRSTSKIKHSPPPSTSD